MSEAVVTFCEARRLGDPHKQVDRFRAYHEAKGSLMADWDAALRTWMLNQQRFAQDRGPRPPSSAQRTLHFGAEDYGEGDSLAVAPPATRE